MAVNFKTGYVPADCISVAKNVVRLIFPLVEERVLLERDTHRGRHTYTVRDT